MEQDKTSIRWWDFLAGTLLMAALLTAATRLVVTRWTDHLAITQTLVFFGVLAGLALGKSRFTQATCLVFAAAYGTFAIPWQLGMTISAELLWGERLLILVNRLSVIIYQLVNGNPVEDSLLFIVIMCMLFWTLAVHAGYTLVRHGSAWGSLLPTGVTIFIIHAFDPLVTRRTWYLAAFILFSLIIVARMVFLQRQKRWQDTRTALPPHLGMDYIQFTILATFLIVFLSWTAPAAANSLPAAQKAWQPVQKAWVETRQRFENAFASLRTSVGIVSTFYGSSTYLGRGTPLTDKHIFSVRAPEDLPPGIRLYWRARIYDTYDNGQWYSTINSVHNFDPDKGGLQIPVEESRWLGTFEFINAQNTTTLFTPSQPFWVSQRGQVDYAENEDGSVDISSFRAQPSLDAGKVYQAQSSISVATQAELRAAGIDYPAWISERYLQLPVSITTRTLQLAADITAGAQTPFDKAVAITDYLRKNMQYLPNLDEEVPERQEIIDWFLFDYRKGFCNYYATAEVILLRAAGIPARWAVGFAQGDRYVSDIPTTQDSRLTGSSFIARQRDAHSWPEAYFPGYGWIEFEPTASQPAIVRAPGDPAAAGIGNFSGNGEAEEQARRDKAEELALLRERQGYTTGPLEPDQKSPLTTIFWAIAFLALAGASLFAWRYRSRWKFPPAAVILEHAFIRAGLRPPKFIQRLARQAALPPLTKAYLEVNRALARLGRVPAVTNTPAERAEILANLLPPAQDPAFNLVYEYEREMFGGQSARLLLAQDAAKELRKLSTLAALRRLLARLQKPENPLRKRDG